MVQRTSLMKPSAAKVLDKVHKSGSLYACLINRETIKLKPSYINRWEISCKSLIVWGLFWLLFKIGSFSFVIKLACYRRRSDSENTIWTTPATLIMTKVGNRIAVLRTLFDIRFSYKHCLSQAFAKVLLYSRLKRSAYLYDSWLPLVQVHSIAVLMIVRFS